MTTSVGNNSVFRSFFEKQKLTGPNFIDWYRQLRLVLSTEDKEYYLEHPIPAAPVAQPGQQIPPEDLAAHAAWVKGQKEVAVLMLLTMDLDIQRNLAHLGAYDMLQELKAMFSKQAEQELLQTVREFHTCKQEEGQSVSSHVLKMKGYIDNLERLGQPVGQNLAKLETGALSLYVDDGHSAAVEGNGKYHLEYLSGISYCLEQLAFCSSIIEVLFLFRVCFDDGFVIVLDDNKCYFVSIGYMIGVVMAVPREVICESDWFVTISYSVWSSKKRIEKLQHDGLLNSIDIESLGKCVSCLSGKMARKPYSHQVERAKDLLGLIHTVVFQKEVKNQLGKTIKSLRSDRGGEYMSQEFLDHLKEHGIIAHRTPPYTPQNNRVSERRNRTLLDMVRSMMSQTTLPKSFWDYALETAARILNMVPSKKVDKTPYEIWHGQAPKLSYLRVWGCEAFVKHDTLTKPDKLDPRSFKSIFVGYPKETMGYSFYSPSENKVFVARNAEFFESKLLDLKASGSVEDLEEIQEEDTNPSVDMIRTDISQKDEKQGQKRQNQKWNGK
ncbi:retrotransposon protein, putative, ty1-copia subclass, partial [Tanacetum coccineum]